ncbi:hypothetical protein FGO68_gene1583 [Halteria grandinella]|uniref:Uncharacterized protein n=1 Tax=Halteria grandinella TaxID=5974 RepID=A0A8J8P7S5_HALGN|nr:hypothetical protein FGO68_gene1583 [Halteria grandinella]
MRGMCVTSCRKVMMPQMRFIEIFRATARKKLIAMVEDIVLDRAVKARSVDQVEEVSGSQGGSETLKVVPSASTVQDAVEEVEDFCQLSIQNTSRDSFRNSTQSLSLDENIETVRALVKLSCNLSSEGSISVAYQVKLRSRVEVSSPGVILILSTVSSMRARFESTQTG